MNFDYSGTQKKNSRLRILFSLLAIAVLLAGQNFLPQSSLFVSKEVRFSEGSESGLRIVPASCPSDPHSAGQCDPPAQPAENGCVLFATPSSSDGGSVILGWNSRGVSNLRIFPGNIAVGTSGTRSVYPPYPSSPATYTITAIGSNGVSSCEDDVVPPPPSPTPSPNPQSGCSGEACEETDPPEIDFWADRYLLQRGNTTTLRWATENVNYCILEDYGSTEGDGSFSTTTEAINSQTTFLLTCAGEDGTIVDDDLVIDIIPVFCETGVEGCNNPPSQSSIRPSSQVAAVAATTEGNLSATIRASILSDPRSAQMSEAEIDAIVSALTAEAAENNVTSYDILWRPQEEPQLVAQEGVATCNFLCMLTQAFGFDGSDIAIPIGLGVTAALLLFVIGAILHHRHGRHPIAGDLKVNVE